MKLTATVAALAVVATPLAVGSAQTPTKADPPAKRVCTVTPTIGSRVNNVRRCQTREERETAKQEARQVVDRVQLMKPTTCPPNC